VAQMAKTKHNKKRNTAFLYEALVREMTKAVVSQDKERKNNIVDILKESFSANKILGQELRLYQTIIESTDLDDVTAEKLLYKIREAYSELDEQEIYDAQSSVINRINKEIGSDVYNNFVPNYKSIATVSQLFGADSTAVGIKRGVILEQQVLKALTANTVEESKTEMKPIDNIVFKTFTSKFNETYGDNLLSEQKELLNQYILSFSSDIDMKIYLNEELGRLHGALQQALTTDEIKSDNTMTESTNSVINMIEEFRDTPVDKSLVEKVLKIQNLVHEIAT
tara:strand:- start:235 stop:1077 length:843 start_codon:yes stop_codon:yes gene_type:complete